MDSTHSVRTVLITGGRGNLGTKLIDHLRDKEWCRRIVCLDLPGDTPSVTSSGERIVLAEGDLAEGDLADGSDPRWRTALAGADAVVHLAARNPYPDASWSDAVASFDMTANLLAAAERAGVRRFVFASSNHVMGQYKDPPFADGTRPGSLTTDLKPGPGTRWFNGRHTVQGSAYAVSKLMGERACVAGANLSHGRLTCVAVRIGWCQPGENNPRTINAAGLPGTPERTDPDAERDLQWFRGMWLSNRDYAQVMERALLADPGAWPSRGIVVNGMSANRGMPWDIETTRLLLGYSPSDNVWDHLA